MKYTMEDLVIQDTEQLLWGDPEIVQISDEIYDTSRWSEFHELVFEKDGKKYITTYSRGATEIQDEMPWENEPPVIYDAVETTVVKYTAKKD